MKRKWLAVGIILLFIGTSIIPSTAQDTENPLQTSSGKWWYVGGSGPGNYTRIQDAINASLDGDTIFVFEGTYYENILIQKAINLLAENVYMTTIIGDYSGNYLSTITIQHSNVIFKDFTVKGTSYAIGLYANYVTVENNHISGTQGIYVGSSYNSILYNNITGYGLPGSFPGRGIELWNSNNKMEHNSIFSGYGIECAAVSDDNFINDNLIVQDDGTILYGGARAVISNNTFRGSGLWLDGVPGNIIVSNNTVNGKPLVFLDNIADSIIDYDTGQVVLIRCENVTVEDQNFSHLPYSVQVLSSRHCYIVNNTISYCFGTFGLGAGIAIYSSTYITVMNNMIEKSAIQIGQSDFGVNHNIIVSLNTLTNYSSISIRDTNNCSLLYNNLVNIYLDLYFFCYNCSVVYNNFIETRNIVIYVPVESHTVLNGNYWGKLRVAPKVIRGTVFKGSEWPWELVRLWFFIDWHPAKEPYDIAGMS